MILICLMEMTMFSVQILTWVFFSGTRTFLQDCLLIRFYLIILPFMRTKKDTAQRFPYGWHQNKTVRQFADARTLVSHKKNR